MKATRNRRLDVRVRMAMAGVKDFNPDEPRNPHTGEWIDTSPGDILSGDQAENYLNLGQAPLPENLANSLEDYQGSGAYWVNKMLRGEDVTQIPGWGESGRSVEELRSLADDMEASFAKSRRLGRPVTVYRGIKGKPSDYGLETGNVATDAGYGSTSVSESVAEAAGGSPFQEKFVMQLTVVPGVRIMWVNRATTREGWWNREKELLLERGCRLVVERTDGDVVKVTVLPPK